MLKTRTSSIKRLALIAAFLVAFLVVLNATTYALYRRARTHLDNELGQRLRSVATGLARAVEIATPADSIDVSPALYSLLLSTRDENALSNIVVLRPDGRTVVDIEGFVLPGEPNPFVDLDYSAVSLARAGIPSYTALYRAGDVYMKSAYAPVIGTGGDVVALVGVEAGAAFFTELRELTRLIIIIGGASALVVVVLGLFFFRQSRRLDRVEEAIVQRENLATMGRMVANIAHEIRNPLSVIRTSSERLRRRHPEEEEILSYITDEVDELNRILTGYLQFAHSGTDRAGFGPQSLQKIVARSLMAVQPDLTARGIEVEDRLPADAVTVHGDEKRLRQAVLNVLINAAQASEPGGRVGVEVRADGREAAIEISDGGPGIDPRDLKEVTKPFFTKKADGSGLGLSIVESIVEEHGGRLRLESEVGRGTTVVLTLPLSNEVPHPEGT